MVKEIATLHIFNEKRSQLLHLNFERAFLFSVNLLFGISGSIWSCWRIKSTGPCHMDLSNFPMDSISCMLTFESYNYNIQEVRMKWNEPHDVLMFKDIELPDFTLVNYTTSVTEAVISSFFLNLEILSLLYQFQIRIYHQVDTVN